MTPDEYEGRVPLRPEIEKALRERDVDTSRFWVGPRPSWVGRAPGPVRVEEADLDASQGPAGPGFGAVAHNPDGTTTVTHEVDGGRLSNTYIAAEQLDLTETFKGLGLSDEAARHAASGR